MQHSCTASFKKTLPALLGPLKVVFHCHFSLNICSLTLFQDDPMYEVGLDIRSQLRVFEQIDEVERKKRDARERDILMRAVRVSHFELKVLVRFFLLGMISHGG